MVTHNKLQFARPGINEAGPLRFEEYVATVLDEKSIGFAAERCAGCLALLHDHLVGLFHDRQILVMVKIHDGTSDKILRQITQRTHRCAVHVRYDASCRMAYGEFGTLLREYLVGN